MTRSASAPSRALPGLAGLAIFLLPLSVVVHLSRTEGADFSIRVPFADAFLWLALLWGCIRRSLNWNRELVLGAIALVMLGLCTTISNLDRGASLVEVIQRMDYFVVGWIVFLSLRPQTLEKLLTRGLGTLAFLVVGIGLWQTWILALSPDRQVSLFEDRHLYNAWLAIVLSILVPRMVSASWSGRLAIFLLCLVGFSVSSTLYPLLGVLIGGVTASWRAIRHQRALKTIAVLIVSLGLAFVVTPTQNRSRAFRDWSARDVQSRDELGNLGRELDLLMTRTSLFHLRAGSLVMQLETPNWHEEAEAREDLRRLDAFQPDYARQRYLEWLAAFYAFAESPALGSGLGSYQRNVSRNYLNFIKMKTLEPNTQSTYMVEIVNSGLIGLLALMTYWVWFARASKKALAHSSKTNHYDPRISALYSGLCTTGALGIAVPIFQTPLVVLPIALLAANVPRSSARDGDSHPAQKEPANGTGIRIPEHSSTDRRDEAE